MHKSMSAFVFALIAGFTASAQATIVQSSTDLATYDKLVTFSSPSLAPNTVVTNQYAAEGLMFSALGNGAVRANSCGVGGFTEAGMSGDTLNTFGPDCITNGTNDAFSMKFANDVAALSLSLRSASGSTANTITAFNDGVSVGQWGYAGYFSNRLMFTNIIFDELRFAEGGGTGYFIFDNVAYVNANTVPEPLSLSLFGLGLAGLAAARRKSKQS